MPYAECVINWEMLLPFWDAFEERGLSVDLLNKIDSQLETPIGVLGCGRGLLVSHLAATHGVSQVEGYDSLQGMLEAAAENGTRNLYLATPDRPIPATRPLGSLIIATGVLDSLRPKEIGSLLFQSGAILRPNGCLFLSVFNREGSTFAEANGIGADHPLGFRWPPMLRHYLSERAEKNYRMSSFFSRLHTTVRKVAKMRECSPEEAVAWLGHVLPRVRRLFRLEQLIDLTLEAGFTRCESHESKDGDVILLSAARPIEVTY